MLPRVQSQLHDVRRYAGGRALQLQSIQTRVLAMGRSRVAPVSAAHVGSDACERVYIFILENKSGWFSLPYAAEMYAPFVVGCIFQLGEFHPVVQDNRADGRLQGKPIGTQASKG